MAEALLDLPALAGGFGRALHRAGVPVTPERTARFARALAVVRPGGRTALYWTARVAFVSGREQVPAFDAVFGAVFDGLADPADARGDPAAPPAAAPGPAEAAPAARPSSPPAPLLEAAGRALVAAAADARDDGGAADVREAVLAAASPEERLRTTRLDRLTPEELVLARRLMARLAVAPPLRRTRRARRGRHGERLDVRATLRRSRRSGGDPVRLARRRRRERPRRLVLLLDVSGSMEPYARAYLQLLQGAVGGARAEAFVFATRLTRLTRALAGRSPQAALDRAAAAAPDWAGGTRIGEALRAFNDRFGRRGLARGAVVVVVSDGWERDDPALVGREMARLARLAHRIVWVNPRRAAAGYAPLAGGMAAALPHVDAFLSGHTLAALDEVLDAIGAP
jgi:uncharacterized protein with von Willebrand factor type A (vWA) domain